MARAAVIPAARPAAHAPARDQAWRGRSAAIAARAITAARYPGADQWGLACTSRLAAAVPRTTGQPVTARKRQPSLPASAGVVPAA